MNRILLPFTFCLCALLSSCAPVAYLGRQVGLRKSSPSKPQAFALAPQTEYEAAYTGQRNKLLLELSRGGGQ